MRKGRNYGTPSFLTVSVLMLEIRLHVKVHTIKSSSFKWWFFGGKGADRGISNFTRFIVQAARENPLGFFFLRG